MAKFRTNLQVRGRLVTDPKLVVIPKKNNPSQTHLLCNFTLAVNLNDQRASCKYFKFTAWDNQDKGITLASMIIENFAKGDWMSVIRSEPAPGKKTCSKCKVLYEDPGCFTAYEIDGYDMMGMGDKTDNDIQDEMTLIPEDDDGMY